MNIKTENLTGAALDWAVATCLGHQVAIEGVAAQAERFKARLLPEEGYTPPPQEAVDAVIANLRPQLKIKDDSGFNLVPVPSYSNDWSQGGPIIGPEKLDVLYMGDGVAEHYWRAEAVGGYTATEGATPLIAAMRCYVASKLGDTVDVPNELINN